MEEVLRLPLSVDLSGFLRLLQQRGIPSRVAEVSGEQVLWVRPVDAERAALLYQQQPEGLARPAVVLPSMRHRPDRASLQAFMRVPVTLIVLAITGFAALVTELGEYTPTLHWFSMVDFRSVGQYVYFDSLDKTLAQGEWWRLITPIFIHFGFLHLTMNSLWYWELGKRVEVFEGSLRLILLTVVLALASNLTQYVFSGTHLFGGLSGVIYGLLGYCWIYCRVAPNPSYELPPSVIGLMLVWLLITLSGVVEVVSMGEVAIANAAHVSGLVAGCLIGGIRGALSRYR